MNGFVLKEKKISVEFENDFVMRKKHIEEDKKKSAIPKVFLFCVINSRLWGMFHTVRNHLQNLL